MTAESNRYPVMLLTTNLARGGAETQVALLAVALRQRGWSVSVASLVEPTAFVERLETSGVPVYSLGLKPGRPSPLALASWVALLQETRPAILHAHMFHANLLARSSRLVAPIPVVISTIHSLAESSQRSSDISKRDWLYRASNRLSDANVCVSEAVADRHRESGAIPANQLLVIPNGADASHIQPSANARIRIRAELGIGEEFVWLAAGRLMWKKDYVTLLEAAATLGNYVLLVAGEGPLDEKLRKLAAELKVNVRFLGLREDIPALMSASDAFVMSSVVEGLPMALIEAALCELPSVATNVGGVAEVVVDQETGMVVPPREPQQLAAAMRTLAEKPMDLRLAMGNRARLRAVSLFDIAAVAAKWESLYEDCMENAAARLMP